MISKIGSVSLFVNEFLSLNDKNSLTNKETTECRPCLFHIALRVMMTMGRDSSGEVAGDLRGIRGRGRSVGAAAGGVRDLVLHLHGRGLGRLSAAALPDERARLHQPGGQPHQSALQHRRHPERGVALRPRGPHGVAADLGGGAGHAAGGAHRRRRPGARTCPIRGPSSCSRAACCCTSACAWSAISCADRRSRPIRPPSSDSSGADQRQGRREDRSASRGTEFACAASPSTSRVNTSMSDRRHLPAQLRRGHRRWHLRHRRRRHHRPVLRGHLRAAGLHGGRGCPDGHLRHLGGRGAFYQAIAPFYPALAVAPDWPLGLLFGLGGMAGMYLGARGQKFVPARLIKIMLSLIILFTALKYVVGF